MKHKLTDKINAVANGLLADVDQAFSDGDEVAAFKALERLKIGAEALKTLNELAKDE